MVLLEEPTNGGIFLLDSQFGCLNLKLLVTPFSPLLIKQLNFHCFSTLLIAIFLISLISIYLNILIPTRLSRIYH